MKLQIYDIKLKKARKKYFQYTKTKYCLFLRSISKTHNYDNLISQQISDIISESQLEQLQNGEYFVTICTKDRVNYFGEITDNEMVLSEIGEVANQCIIDTNKHFPNVEVSSHVIMPNHIHAIIIIKHTANDEKQKFGPQSRNLASVIRGIKIGVTKYARNNNIPFEWQRLYYDTIIRDINEMNRIVHYINNNVANWVNDNIVKRQTR